MSIPDLDDDGFLPEGIHVCSLGEIGERFGGTSHGGHRSGLFAKLVDYIQEVRTTDRASGLMIDSSFVTSKSEPNDIDLVLILSPNHDFSMELRPFEYNALSRRRVARRYAFDLLIAREDSPELHEYAEFFQQVRGQPHRRKGILKVQL